MEDLLDEVTVTVTPSREPSKAGHDPINVGIPLSHANVLKNKARYMLAIQNSQSYDNRLLNACSDLLSYAVTVRRMQCPDDLYVFRAGLKQAITELKYKIAKLEYPPSVADKTCFLLAAMIDEQIVHSAWGEGAGWENQMLVSELFGIKNGGEQFYVVAERALLQPVLLVDLLELIFILLKVGFKGRYRAGGQEQLSVLQQRLEEAVFARQRSYLFSERIPDVAVEEGKVQQAKQPQKPIRVFRLFLGVLAVSVLSWGGLQYWYDTQKPIKASAFSQLTDFTDDLYKVESTQDNEYVYVSTPADINRLQASNPVRSSSGSRANTAINDPSTVWVVQLATFNSRSQVEQFQQQYQRAIPDTVIDEWRGKYRLLSVANNRENAAQTLTTANQQGIADAFIYSDKRR
ncbi:type IV secretion protein DotU [Photobacterium rosenbergii]|uniref:Type IV secretion protein DotU n=1 Tax=Photobacterium rosenbergii TaxID=294936 RepID=A0A2T3NL12_9GAMM|nr:type IVB secretion system protein IcmH/DotU [Photobacterium rosenbergii]PSW16132.1 type IV secretion protein DotU [Photobacterium rosenbergii]